MNASVSLVAAPIWCREFLDYEYCMIIRLIVPATHMAVHRSGCADSQLAQLTGEFVKHESIGITGWEYNRAVCYLARGANCCWRA